MSGVHHHDIVVPRPVRLMVGTLLLAVIALVAAVSAKVIDPAPRAADLRDERGVTVLVERSLVFADASGGAVLVSDAARGEQIAVLDQQQSGFVRGVMRAIARERRAFGFGSEIPVNLALWSNGELTLTDPATGRQMELAGFGPTNRAAFATLLPQESSL